ncbi:hypothetical protein [Planococcus versutus]|uniref:Uncharacterized protein n=1 Tax=Planococcus versutus TaxID=1302659 RepID=A0A1B1S5I0_9BACL|nr:hypothetical protein [Planococcus versutus]ANU28448.1 hypothetical protein I858_015775 [Planococcus versutus]
MATPKEEKLLSSIDSTLKDILKELKKQGRSVQSVIVDTVELSQSEIEQLEEMKIARAIKQY